MYPSTTAEPRQADGPATPALQDSHRWRRTFHFWIAVVASLTAGGPGAQAACDTNEATILDLSNWTVIQYGPFLQPPANWILSDTNTVVIQAANADASIFLSPDNLQNIQVQGSWMVNTNDDDDFIGFVLGYQDAQHFYLFDWKQLDQANQPMWGFAEQGMSVKVISANSTLTATDFGATVPPDTNRVRLLYHNRIPWVEFTSYDFNLEFRPGHFNITVSQGATVLDSIGIDDSTYTNGLFGFYNFSQSAVRYSGFTGRGLVDRPVVSVTDPSVLEGDTGPTSLAFSVNLSRTNCQTIRINYAITPGSATAGLDYTAAASGTLAFAPGETNRLITVTVWGDRLNEANETLILSLSDPVTGILGDSQGIGTIIDDDPVPALRLEDVSVREGDLGTTPAVFRLTLSGPSGQSIQVGYSTSNLTAAAGQDYIAIPSMLLTIPAGQTNAFINVSVRGDILVETDETFSLCLNNPIHGTLDKMRAIGTIRNDDTNSDLAITKSASPSVLTVGLLVEYTITVRNLGPAQAVGVVVTDILPPGLDNIDIVSSRGACTILDDTVTCNLGTLAPGSQAGGGQIATITIKTVAARHGMLLNSASVVGDLFDPNPVNNTATASVTVVNRAPVVTLIRPEADPCLTLPTNLAIIANALDMDGSVELVEFYDHTDKLGESLIAPFAMTWSNVLAGSHLLTAVARDDSGARATSAPVALSASFPSVLSIDDQTVVEGNPGASAMFTISLDSPNCRTVSVVVVTANGSARAGSDYTAVSTPLTFLPGETRMTVSVPILDDAAAESTETFTVCLTNALHALVAMPCGVGTILDDDDNPPPTVVITTPTNGAAFSSPPGLVTIEADARDRNGSVQRVDFYGDGMFLGATTTTPFTVPWTNNILGIHVLTAIATDNDGARATSAPVNITIRTCNPGLNASPLTDQTRCLCDEVTFSSTVSSSEPASFVWKLDGIVLPGQTSPTLLLQNLKPAQAGTYSVEIGTGCASITRSATLTLVGAGSQNPVSFTNASAITITDHAPASPYPAALQVGCVPGRVKSVSVTLDGISHNFPDDIDVLLLSPAGRAVKLMSDTGGTGSFKLTNVVLTFTDSAAGSLPDATRIFSGTYAPTDYLPADAFPAPAPAPAAIAATNFIPFLNTDPNGTWSLFVIDDLGGDAGIIARGWSLTIGWDEVAPVLAAPTLLADGRFQMTLNAQPRMTHVLETSTDLAHWIPISTNTPGTSAVMIIDARPSGEPCRFYRAVRCP